MGLEFPNPVNLVPYEAVLESEYLNAALAELTDRTVRIAEYVSTATSSKLLRSEQQLCDASVQPRDVVYWNADDQRFAPALAEVYDNAGVLEVANRGLAMGVCETKRSANVGDIVLAGVMSLTMAEAASMLYGETVGTGVVYLSANVPGKLTRTKPAVPVSVGFMVVTTVSCDATCLLFLGSLTNLEPSRVVEYALTALPAGDHVPPAFGGTHVITNPDANAFGWLPADHAIFDGTAPVGAKFGYNIAKEPTLQALWPPTGRKLKLEFVSGGDIGVAGFKRVQADFYQVAGGTIWWMRDCYSQVPWNYELDNTVSGPAADPCDVTAPDQMILTFERSGLEASQKFVTKLNPSANSVIRFVDPQGVEASRGELTPVLNTALAITSSSELGSLALKTAGPGFQFKAGRVIEGLRSLSDSLVVTGSHSRPLDPNAAVSSLNPLLAQGVVSISLSTDSVGQDLGAAQVRLGDSQQKLYKGVSYIGLPSTHASEVTCRFDVPFGSAKTMTLTPYVILFGRGAGPYQEVTATFQKIGAPPLPENGNTIQSQSQPLVFDVETPSAAAVADTVLRVNTAPIQVFGGETVFVTFRRSLTTYTHDVGFIRIGAILRTL